MHPLRQLLRKYEWVHLTLGFIGNTCFVIGSVLFLWETTQIIGTWLFIIGASGMWIGSTGSAIVGYARHEKEHDRRPRRHESGDHHAHGGAR